MLENISSVQLTSTSHPALLVGKTDLNVDKSLLDKLLTIQQLPEEDREHILYSIDGLIQLAKTGWFIKSQSPTTVGLDIAISLDQLL